MHAARRPSSIRPQPILPAMVAALVFAPACAAGTLTVLNSNGSGPGSLRQALLDAAPGDTIDFHASLSGATIGPDPLTLEPLRITKDLTIDGSALPSKVSLSGDLDGDGTGDTGVISVQAGVVASLKNLIITRGNTAGAGPGIANSGNLTIVDCEVTHNVSSSKGRGGGIATFGPMSISGSTIANNTSGLGGGGIAVNIAAFTMTNSNVTGNGTPGNGGGIWVSLANAGGVTITGSTIAGNTATFDGAGIYNEGQPVNLIGSRVTGNTSGGNGGGLFGGFAINSSVVSNNTAGFSGGGIYVEGNKSLTVTASTLAGNQAASGGYGGAILNRSSATSTLINSTLSGNSAGFGGGIYNQSSGVVNLASVTLANNQSPNPGGIGGLANVGVVHFVNTLIAGSTNGDCAALGPGSFPTRSGNLVQEGTCFASSAFLSVMLGPLADNGGPTQTHALLPGSPAIDYGDNSYCDDNPGANNLDQRGVTRPIDGDGIPGAVCDTGAFELVVQTGPIFANGFE